MGFDEQTLSPTYKLLLNIVGRSYALEISSRLGLKQEIINKAKEFKNDKSNDLDALIDELSQKMQSASQLRDYETAIIYRDKISYLNQILKRNSLAAIDGKTDIIVIIKKENIAKSFLKV